MRGNIEREDEEQLTEENIEKAEETERKRKIGKD